MAISLDGRIAFHKNKDKRIGGASDRRILEESLAWADGTLIGAETIRIHKNTCLIHNQSLIAKRIADGRPKQPKAIVVSTKNNLSKNLPFFNQPIKRWLLTQEGIKISSYDSYESILYLQKSWLETFRMLQNQGIKKLVILGGSKLSFSILEEDQINELNITLIPKVIGGDNHWIPQKESNHLINLSKSDSWIIRENRTLESNEILLRYLRNQ